MRAAHFADTSGEDEHVQTPSVAAKAPIHFFA